MDVDRLIERLLKIESLHAGATTTGEKVAAEEALGRILARLEKLEDEPEEFRFTLTSRWSQQLFIALARRYKLKPFRRRRQHATTIMLRVKRRFVDETFVPQFNALHDELTKHLDEVAKTIIEAAVHRDLTDVPEVADRSRARGCDLDPGVHEGNTGDVLRLRPSARREAGAKEPMALRACRRHRCHV